jgi:hypothetical protein
LLILAGLCAALGVLQASAVRADLINTRVNDFLDRWQSQSISCSIVDSTVAIAVPVCVRLLHCAGSLRLAVSVHDAADQQVDKQCESNRRNSTNITASNSTFSDSTNGAAAVRPIEHLLVPPGMTSIPLSVWENIHDQYNLESLFAIPQLHLLDTRAELTAIALGNSIASSTANVARWIVVGLLICWLLCCVVFTVWICFARTSRRAQQDDYRARIDAMIEDVWGAANDRDDDDSSDFKYKDDRSLTTLEDLHKDAETRVAELLLQSARGIVPSPSRPPTAYAR